MLEQRQLPLINQTTFVNLRNFGACIIICYMKTLEANRDKRLGTNFLFKCSQ